MECLTELSINSISVTFQKKDFDNLHLSGAPQTKWLCIRSKTTARPTYHFRSW